MEWLVLGTWIVVVPLALAIGGAAISAPTLGLGVAGCVAGLVLSILYTIDAADWLAWAAVGAAALGIAGIGSGVVALMSEERSPATATAQSVEETAAGLSGVALALLAAAAGVSVLLALHL